MVLIDIMRNIIRGIFWGAFGEAERTRNRLAIALVVPLVFIVPGAFLGAVSVMFKEVFILIGITIATLILLWLAWRSALVGIGGIALLTGGKEEGRGAIETAALAYVRFVSAIVTSEIAIGLLLLLFPAHSDPVLSLFLIPIGLAVGTYTIWQGGMKWWPKIVWRTITIAIALIVIWVIAKAIMPNTITNNFGESSIASEINAVRSSMYNECMANIQRNARIIRESASTSGLGYTPNDLLMLEALKKKESRCSETLQEPDLWDKFIQLFRKNTGSLGDELDRAIDKMQKPASTWQIPKIQMPSLPSLPSLPSVPNVSVIALLNIIIAVGVLLILGLGIYRLFRYTFNITYSGEIVALILGLAAFYLIARDFLSKAAVTNW